MRGAFEDKEMESIDIILLVHKMLVCFPQQVFDERIVTPQLICEFVKGIGFGCSLLGMSEIVNEGRRNAHFGDDSSEELKNSKDSLRLRGL